MLKLITLAMSSVLGLALTGLFGQPPPPPDEEGPPPKVKAKDKAKAKKGAPGDELRKAYDLLRRVRAEVGDGRAEERLKGWSDRATSLYRRAIRARAEGEPRQAREYGAAAHDLARAIDHARNAARLERPDPDLPAPGGSGPEDVGERTRRDLRHAYDRIRDAAGQGDADAKFYLDAARDLYNAARRDVEAGRDERGGELARAAEAMTHVPEHVAHAERGPERPEPKEKEKEKEKERRGPRGDFDPAGPKAERSGPAGRELPPPLP